MDESLKQNCAKTTVSNPYGDPRLQHPGNLQQHPGSLAFPDVEGDNDEDESDPPMNGDLPPGGGVGAGGRSRFNSKFRLRSSSSAFCISEIDSIPSFA